MQPNSPESETGQHIRRLFANISRHYDVTNRWMTWGQDARWRHEVLDKANLPIGGRLLDVGAGTGDLSVEAVASYKPAVVAAVDITPQMMQIGRQRASGEPVFWINSDALDLPFPCELFDRVISGYLLRNVPDVERALAEQYRVLKWGGRVVCLDTSPPPGDLWHLPVRLYLHFILPFIGGMIAGDVKAYRYLARSTEGFLKAEELASRFRKVGFKNVGYKQFIGGVITVHWGDK